MADVENRSVPEAVPEPVYVLHSPVDHRLVDVLCVHVYVESGEFVCACGQHYKPQSIDTPLRQWVEHVRLAMAND